MLIHLISLVLLAATLLPGFTGSAEAIPAYARKYSEKCSFCHSVWPQLNRRGEDFKINGYQLSENGDGDTKGKEQLGDNNFLDIGDANPPLSAELQIEIVLERSTKTQSAESIETRRSLLGGSTRFSLYGSSTLNKNISWFAKYTAGRTEIDKGAIKQGFLTITNLDKYKIVNIEAGISNLNQHSVLTYNRNALFLPMTLGFGGVLYPSENSTTIQVFGTPEDGIFTYSLGISDNSGRTSNDIALGGMLRLDFRPIDLAVSYNYLGGRTRGITGFTGNLGGEAFDRTLTTVQANRYNTHLLAVRKDWKAATHRAWIGFSSEDNFLHNFLIDSVKREQVGYGTDIWVYAFNVEFGAGLDYFQQKSQKNVLWTNSKGIPQKNVRYLKVAMALNYLLSDNSKVGISYQLGGFESEYLKGNNLFRGDSLLLAVDLTI